MSYNYQKIDSLINESGVSYKSFFAKAGISEKYYNACKMGKIIPKEDTMRQLANKLNVPFQDIKMSQIPKRGITQKAKPQTSNVQEGQPKTSNTDIVEQSSVSMESERKKPRRRSINYIINNIDLFLHTTSRKERYSAANRLRQAPYKEDALRLVEEMLLTAPTSDTGQLLMLLFIIDRKKNILFCLDSLAEKNIKLADIAFFSRIEAVPLNDYEEKKVAEHICKNPNFDLRLLNYLHGDNLDYVLENILQYSLTNGLTIRCLRALSYKKEYLTPLQELIRNNICRDSFKYQHWINYLDLSLQENQLLIHDKYSIFSIYRQLRASNSNYHDSEYLSIRIVLCLLHKKHISAEDWQEMKKLILQEISSSNIDENKTLISFLKDAYYVDADFAESMLITIYKRTTLYTRTVLDILANVRSPFAYREMVSILLTTSDNNERFRVVRCLIQCYPNKANAIMEYVKTLNDSALLRLASKETASINQPEIPNEVSTFSNMGEGFRIIPRTEQINEVLFDLAKQIDANTVFAAVGFAFASGLRTLSGLIDYVNKGHRILTWLKYEPTDYFSDLEIPALDGYTLFVYEAYSLGVFESFSRDNAYYVFRCISVEQLLSQVAQLTKTEMANINVFIGRGYHIHNQDHMKDKIAKYFERK